MIDDLCLDIGQVVGRIFKTAQPLLHLDMIRRDILRQRDLCRLGEYLERVVYRAMILRHHLGEVFDRFGLALLQRHFGELDFGHPASCDQLGKKAIGIVGLVRRRHAGLLHFRVGAPEARIAHLGGSGCGSQAKNADEDCRTAHMNLQELRQSVSR
jgi:hypothetical protein